MQTQYNAEHGITPPTIQKAIRSGIETEMKARRTAREAIHERRAEFDQTEIIRLLEEEMLEAAKNLEFERAAQLRDKINEMKGAPTITRRRQMHATIPPPAAQNLATQEQGQRRREAEDGEMIRLAAVASATLGYS